MIYQIQMVFLLIMADIRERDGEGGITVNGIVYDQIKENILW